MLFLVDKLFDSIQSSLIGPSYPVNYPWTIALVAFFFLLWSAFYFLLCYMNPELTKEWHCRVVTFSHASIISPMCAWAVFFQDRMPFNPSNHGGASTPLQHTIFLICLGYFFFDFSWCLLHGTEGPVMLMHHSCSILGIGVALFIGRWGTELAATVGGAEITNPLLQIRWFLRSKGHRDTLSLRFVELSFMILFGVMRLGLGSVLLYIYLTNPKTDFLGRLAGIIIYSISWVFWISICTYAKQRISKLRRKVADSCHDGAGDHYRKSQTTMNGPNSEPNEARKSK